MIPARLELRLSPLSKRRIEDRIRWAIAERPVVRDAAGEDRWIVSAMGRGDENAAEGLYRRYANRVYRFLLRRLDGSVEDAEDLTVETFLSAVDLARGYDGRSAVFVWLCGIAVVRLTDHHRRHSARRRRPPNGTISLSDLIADPKETTSAIERVLERITATQLLDSAISALNEAEREVLLLRHVEEFTVEETAQIMRRTTRAVESLLLRARAKSKEAIRRLIEESAYD